MTESRRSETLTRLGACRVSAIIRAGDEARARHAMRAAVAGGMKAVEFTLTTPGALDLIREFAGNPELVVGAGTVLTPREAGEAVKAGARFLVSPVMDPRVIRKARALDAVCIPGTYTPTEMMHAVEAGAEILKIFPAPADLPAYVTQILGPLPGYRLFPTAGVTPENFLRVLGAGAFGVGFVASLFQPADLAAERYDAIRDRAVAIQTALAREALGPGGPAPV
jgi:2-dehydro-3-deoxyphosphogluconate aldolase/(4S)-4-hydroxy-2-oxoglutarate aldolase